MSLTRRNFLRAMSAFLSSISILRRGEAAELARAATVISETQELTLWYREPAEQWTEALPVGNGRLGAMVFGGVASERIGLNEDTLWSGAPRDWNNPDAKQHLPIVREEVIQHQNYHAADQECRKMQGPFTQAFEPLGDLLIDFEHEDGSTQYKRSLDLDSAINTVNYRASSGIQYTRETFASAPDQVIVVRLAASKPGSLNCTLRFKSQLQSSVEAKGNSMVLSGKAPSNSVPNYLRNDHPITYNDEPGKGMYFAAVLNVK